jgi:putative oxidoreductase
MTSAGAPAPTLSAIVAIVAGFYTRPLALLLALYTLGTALIGHHYWTTTGMEQYANMINFYKNIGIIGALLLLCATGPGKYSLDRK